MAVRPWRADHLRPDLSLSGRSEQQPLHPRPAPGLHQGGGRPLPDLRGRAPGQVRDRRRHLQDDQDRRRDEGVLQAHQALRAEGLPGGLPRGGRRAHPGPARHLGSARGEDVRAQQGLHAPGVRPDGAFEPAEVPRHQDWRPEDRPHHAHGYQRGRGEPRAGPEQGEPAALHAAVEHLHLPREPDRDRRRLRRVLPRGRARGRLHRRARRARILGRLRLARSGLVRHARRRREDRRRRQLRLPDLGQRPQAHPRRADRRERPDRLRHRAPHGHRRGGFRRQGRLPRPERAEGQREVRAPDERRHPDDQAGSPHLRQLEVRQRRHPPEGPRLRRRGGGSRHQQRQGRAPQRVRQPRQPRRRGRQAREQRQDRLPGPLGHLRRPHGQGGLRRLGQLHQRRLRCAVRLLHPDRLLRQPRLLHLLRPEGLLGLRADALPSALHLPGGVLQLLADDEVDR